jgi:hypothetical protein
LQDLFLRLDGGGKTKAEKVVSDTHAKAHFFFIYNLISSLFCSWRELVLRVFVTHLFSHPPSAWARRRVVHIAGDEYSVLGLEDSVSI